MGKWSQAFILPRDLVPNSWQTGHSQGNCNVYARYLGLVWAQALPIPSHLPNTLWHYQPKVEIATGMPTPWHSEACSPNPDPPHTCAQAPAGGGVVSGHWEGLGRREAVQGLRCQCAGEWVAENLSQEARGGERSGTYEPRT